MRIAVFGATGGTGRHFIEQALAADHQVRALVRDPAKLAMADERLEIVQGDVLDPQAVSQVIEGTDAVLVTLGNTPNNPAMVCTEGTRNVVNAMERLGRPRRLLVVTSLGAGDSRNQVPFALKMLMKTVLKAAFVDKDAQEGVVMTSDLDWTIVRPGGLTDGPRTGQYAAGLDAKITAGQVSRADVAEFLLKQLSDDTFLRQAPAIT